MKKIIEMLSVLPVEVRATSDCVVTEVFGIFLIAIVFQWIRPQQVAHGTKCRWLCESINLKHTQIMITNNLNLNCHQT